MTASRIAQSIENARLYARVSRQAQTLEMLNEIAAELASILDLNPLLERVGQLLRRLIDYQMFTVMLLDEKGDTLVTRYAWRFGYVHAPIRRVPISSGLVGAAVREWRPINVPDVSKDPRYLPMNPETRSELIVPLFYKGRVIGVLDLEHTRPDFFNEEHERMLTTLASQIAIAIENARLYQAVHRQERQLEKDIAMAREVQLRLLPPTRPRILTPIWPSAFCPPAPSAATSTTFSTTDPTARRSCSAT
jgi:phosphoserine phosphatase RsbU/P